MNTLQHMGLTALAASLVACGSMAPNYERPAAPVPAQFPAAPVGAAPAGTAAADLPWQTFFADARLQKLIQIALDNNRDLRVALLNVEQARSLVDASKANRWPTVNAGLGLTRQTVGGGATTSSYSAGLLVTSFEVDLFDRLRSQSDAAFSQYLASTEAGRAAQISLIGSVANTWFALQADTALATLAQQTVKTREESQGLFKLRFDQGASSQLDLSQAQSLLEAARVSLAQSTRQRLLDENALNLLLGQTAPADLIAAVPPPAALADLPVGLPSEVLLRRPDVVQAEQQLLAANANIGAARAAFFPKILLTASAGSVSNALADLFKDGTFGWSLAPQLLLPIFDAGRNQANLASAKVAREVAVTNYEKAIQSAFREVADALAGRATLGQQLAALQAQTRAEAERTQLTGLRFKNGASSYLEVLDAQRSLFALQQAELQLTSQVQQNLATLYRVLGGGWKAAGEK
ncbi:multidrug transporter [Rhodoferax lacus]|uniref:Multidrug transporter n=1 Tax=Rhodoferax lacus TaxID=2184758 RepID=A0A3E1REU2_9BURK|nr:efflux transporter outer membrane subunit [Rhodoferax lacus]RFO97783.1 multidrug transporter [Rhodoferax lacus]